jgi:hypothetical protein
VLDAGGADGGGVDGGAADGGGVGGAALGGGGVDRRADRADRTGWDLRLVTLRGAGEVGAGVTSSTAVNTEGEGEGVGSNGNTRGTPWSARLTASFLAEDTSLSDDVGAKAR